MRKIELLVPASSLEVLKIAVIFGADAVYIGGCAERGAVAHYDYCAFFLFGGLGGAA